MATKKKAPQSNIRVGQSVFIRTVTHYLLGKIVALSKDEILLVDASWIGWPTERHGVMLDTGKVSDVEKIPAKCEPVSVGRGAVVDAYAWPHALPKAST